MKHLYTIYDTLTKDILGQPFTAAADAAAIRAVKHAMQDPQSNLRQTPEDYTLICVGTFTDDNMGLDPSLTPYAVVKISALIDPKPEDN